MFRSNNSTTEESIVSETEESQRIMFGITLSRLILIFQ